MLFLGGTFSVYQVANGDILGEAERTITIKQGTSLFFPLVDAEWDNVLQTPHWGGMILGHPTGVPTLKEIVSVSPDNAVGLFTTLNDANVAYSRLRSGPFAYTLPATDNVLQSSGLDITGTVAPAFPTVSGHSFQVVACPSVPISFASAAPFPTTTPETFSSKTSPIIST